jgi:catechol 2,3-dioxygenase-like lactoylglutathione lyase family enzyme
MKFNALIPELGVSHFEKSLSFYVTILGFRVEYQRPENQFAFLSYQKCQIMIEQANTVWQTGMLEYPYGRGMNLQIEVDAIDPLLQSLQKHAYPLFVEPKERWYRKDEFFLGQREFLVMDPDGYVLRFAQNLGEKR